MRGRIPGNPLRTLVSVVVILAVVITVGVVVRHAWQQRGRCGDGVERHGPRDECIGLTDGSYVFAPELADVQGKILAENRRVLAQGKPYVTIAYFEPMTLVENDVTTYTAVRHGLQGAYLSQRRANHTGEWSGETPLIRMLLANPGSQAREWERVVDRILRRGGGADDIVAVAGLGQSLGGTLDATKRLSEHGILMVGSVITADYFSDVDYLARVVPTNTNEVSAIVEHLKIDTKRAMLVQDTNPDDKFALNIGEVFRNIYPRDGRVLVPPVEEYLSADDPTDSFQRMAPEICVANPDVIFFAGRFRDLTRLLEVLARRPCRELTMRIITGDTIVDVAGNEQVRSSLSANIKVEYLHLADHRAWSDSPAFFLDRSTSYFTSAEGDGVFRTEFPDEALDDGLAILAFDAVGTAVSAIREGADFTRLHGQSSVPGASGWISLDSGDPERKAISLLTLSLPPGASEVAIDRKVTSCSGVPFLARTPGDPDPVRCPA